MKKLKNEKSLFKQNSKIAIAVTMLAIPMLYSPSTIFAQEKTVKVESSSQPLGQPRVVDPYVKWASKWNQTGPNGQYSIVGLDNNQPIYKDYQGKFFKVNIINGDFEYLAKDANFKHFKGNWSTPVRLFGVNNKGEVVYINEKGEKVTFVQLQDIHFVL